MEGVLQIRETVSTPRSLVQKDTWRTGLWCQYTHELWELISGEVHGVHQGVRGWDLMWLRKALHCAKLSVKLLGQRKIS